MYILYKDQEIFEKTFPQAWQYIKASQLRYECYQLALSSYRNTWQKNRLKELLKSPACRELWFVNQLRSDGKIEDYLTEAGI